MRYDEYKPSIIRWNHGYPAHWTCEKAKRFFLNPKKLNKDNAESNILSLTLKGVIENNGSKPIGLSPSDYATYQMFEANELVFKLIDLNNISTSRVGIVPEKGIMSSAYIRFVPRTSVNIKYFYYQYYDWYKRLIFNGLGEGVRQTLSGSDLKNLEILVPPREEQDQIVRYLDWQVSKINKLIAAKKKQIALLEAHRVSALNTAVTRGVRPNRPLKSSGMQWLSQIPADWETIPAKALFSSRHDLRWDSDEMMAATQKYGIIAQRKYMELEGRRIVLANDSLDKWLHVEPDDFIISLRSFQGGLERCSEAGCVTWHYVVLQPSNEALPAFYRWFFKSASYISALQHTSDFIRDGQDLRFSNFVKVRLLNIPIPEQAEIAAYLEQVIPRYDKAIATKEQEIEKLHELRTRLISDVVTGQIDVRGIEVPDFEMVEETEEEAAEEDDTAEEAEEQEE